MVINSSRLGIFVALMFCLSSMSVQAMTARAMFGKELVEENGKRFLQTKVNCTDININRMIVSQNEDASEDDPWCSKDVPSLCADSRVETALLVCSAEYRQATVRQQTIKLGSEVGLEANNKEAISKETKDALRAESLAIKGQLMEINEQKLGILRRELNLQNRAAKLEQRSSKK